MDSTAVDRIADLGVQASRTNRLDTTTPAVILTNDDGQKIVSIEHLQEGRSRFRGALVTDSLEDFIIYTKDNANAEEGCSGFVNADQVAAKVFFNLGDVGFPGHGDWTATLKLKPTAEYAAMLQTINKKLSQRDVLDFAEDWAGNLTAIAADGQIIPAAKALTAIRKLTIKATAEATHTEKDFGARKSSLEEIEASSDDGLPYGFGFTAIPYAGLAQRSFTLRLSVLTNAEKPQLVLRAISLESAQEAIAQEFKRKLADGIGDAATLTLGTFTP